ncbi:hypothetical protein DXG03_004589 [Asterophora parasitica]|uniref:Ebp2-domain-containing protein n=1 Tax=Asterophora parasitica TaxID=117018 RepID=A0A9P7KCW6_9AGAR|nr:hypothetical protein DXG03_004589 [Asterophora parasitica]
MPSPSKAAKGSSKKASPTKPAKSPAAAKPARKEVPAPPPVPAASDSEEEDEDEDSDDEGVDEEGMKRLMNALGDDGLDDFDREQLRIALGEEDESDGESSEDGDEDVEIASDDGEEVWEDEANDDEDEEENENDEEGENDENDENEDEDAEEGVLLEDVDGEVDEDAVPRQKIEIDDKVALERIRETIQLDPSFPWTETLVLSYPQTIDVDVNDDLNRELAFYKQALHSAEAARKLAEKHKFPFTRPADYFAEMVKTDSHMERIRQRLLDESAGIKKSEDKRKEREGKKFGKQVQVEKLKEREKSKKDMEERLKGLKRSRGGGRGGRGGARGGRGGRGGGRGGGSKRPGKDRRIAARSKS